MYPCHYPGCKEEFINHTFLTNHILRDHGQSRVNWNERIVAAIITLALVVSLVQPAYAASGKNAPSGKADVSWCPSCRG